MAHVTELFKSLAVQCRTVRQFANQENTVQNKDEVIEAAWEVGATLLNEITDR